jgi:hypothetical protein
MFHATVYRVVPESQTLSKLKHRSRGLQTSLSHAPLFVRAYDSAELAAFCCAALWTQPSSALAAGRRRLVRETIVVPLEGAQCTRVLRLPRPQGVDDEEALWMHLHETACAQGLFCVYAPSSHAADRHIALLDVLHPAFSHAIACSQRFLLPMESGAAAGEGPLRAEQPLDTTTAAGPAL